MVAAGSSPLYDDIGARYSRTRRPDPRIAAAIVTALADARTVLNVGAGTGSYEPHDRGVVAVDPSTVMLAQRATDAAPAICARAESLPFRDATFDAALAVLTIHHWGQWARGIHECMRVVRERVVILTWDPDAGGFWLVRDYLPELVAFDRGIFPRIAALRALLGAGAEVQPLPVPADCVDGFLGAYWARPTAYLDPRIRAGMSSFGRIPGLERGLARLRAELDDGTWEQKYGALLELGALDIGYRLVVGHIAPSSDAESR
jgi:SAM-dependent methyltransferase